MKGSKWGREGWWCQLGWESRVKRWDGRSGGGGCRVDKGLVRLRSKRVSLGMVREAKNLILEHGKVGVRDP